MYQDLDSNLWREITRNNIILQSFGGANNSSDNGGNVDYADEFEVDKDEFLTNVTLVKDADASQITIIDGLKGKNLAIQGPPGTESQTITNLCRISLSGKNCFISCSKNGCFKSC